MAQVVWADKGGDIWEGTIAGTPWFKIQFVWGVVWNLTSALPIPLGTNISLQTEQEARDTAQYIVDSFAGIVVASAE